MGQPIYDAQHNVEVFSDLRDATALERGGITEVGADEWKLRLCLTTPLMRGHELPVMIVPHILSLAADIGPADFTFGGPMSVQKA